MPTKSNAHAPLVIFAGGGSGGHLFPGVALADEMASSFNWRVMFLASRRAVEKRIFRDRDYEVRSIPSPTFTSNPLKAPGFLWSLVRSLREAGRLIDEAAPAAVIGLGGYASFSPVYAAARRGLPTFVLEQNTVPGKANRLLSRWATAVYAQWEASVPRFAKPERVFVEGNPLRASMRSLDMRESRRELGLDADKRTLVVFGGSQGAAAVNRAMASCADVLKNYKEKLQIFHICGDKDNKDINECYSKGGCRFVVKSFVSEMEKVYSAADLVLGRAGGTSIAELAALKKPSVLVPFPFAAEDHQRKNAAEYAKYGACGVLEENDLSPETVEKEIIELAFDDHKLASMSRAAASVGNPSARVQIAALVREHVTGEIQKDFYKGKERANG